MGATTPAPGRPLGRSLRPPREAARGLAQLAVEHALPATAHVVQRLLRSGEQGAAVRAGERPTVLLFFEDIERDTFVRGDRHARRALRRVYHAVTNGQRVSGFEIWFRTLCLALERAGCRVVVNNHGLAWRHPELPVGLCGYPHVLDRWTLPNPVVLGPGLFDHPEQAPRLMDDPRFRSYLVPCEWMRTMFAPYYGDRLRVWFGGIDLDRWPDLGGTPKDIDLLVYDKIRWDRERYVSTLMTPVVRAAERRGLRVEVLRRGAYDLEQYRALLARSRGLLFLCEHETQGLAYQEAMACNVPILAWDNGFWLDPNRGRWSDAPVPASSVPFFGPECGERFVDADDFPAALDRFVAGLPGYAPRRYVREQLSLERSARLYLEAYAEASAGGQGGGATSASPSRAAAGRVAAVGSQAP